MHTCKIQEEKLKNGVIVRQCQQCWENPQYFIIVGEKEIELSEPYDDLKTEEILRKEIEIQDRIISIAKQKRMDAFEALKSL